MRARLHCRSHALGLEEELRSAAQDRVAQSADVRVEGGEFSPNPGQSRADNEGAACVLCSAQRGFARARRLTN